MGHRLPRLQQEEGFTLVELIITVAITGLLMSAIAGALIVGLKTTDATSARMSESHDAQVTSAYLANDVQSASSVNVSSASTNCTGASTTLITFNYYTGGQTAAYTCGTANGETRVLRTLSSPASSVVVAHFAGAARPTITCTPTCSSSPLDTVTMAFTEASGYSYTLLGSRRAFPTGGGGGTQSTPPLTLLALAGGSSPLWIAGGCSQGQINQGDCIVDPDTPNNPSDNPSLTVNGYLYVNSSTSNAVKLTGKKNATKITINNGGFGILTPGGCTGCTHNTVACAACAWITGNQPWTGYSPALLDPLRFMADPPNSGAGSCSGGVCQPGTYASTLQLTSSATLNPGVYILQNGMSVTGNNTKLTGSGVMLFISSGNMSLGGGSTLNLTPPTSGPYKNILIFQSRSNSSPLKITGGSSAGLTFGGVIYVPSSTQVTLSTGGATLNVTAVVAQSIKISSNAQVIVG
jgi:prepilin-type N-terminal cleavage/methylation domain-containing protein